MNKDKKDKISIIISGIYLIISFVLLGLIIAKCINTKNIGCFFVKIVL